MIISLVYAIVIFFTVFYSTQVIRRKVRNFHGADIVRILLFFLPYIIPSFLVGIHPLNDNVGEGYGIALILAICTSLLALLWHWPQYKDLFNKDMYYLMQPISFRGFVILELSLIGSAVCEEWFYRVFLVGLLIDWGAFMAACLTSLMFTFSHFLQESTREEFSWKAYVTLFVLGLFWSYSIVIGQSVMPAIIGHLLYNLPSMLTTYWSYAVPRRT